MTKQGQKIFITTIQALTQFKEDNLDLLKDNIDLILFDEGHKEPAPTWSKIIRNFKKKTILFTATPIRNDYQIFNVDEEYFYNYPIVDAINEGIIRNVEFKYIDQESNDVKEKIKKFINAIIKSKKEYDQKYNCDAKVIIRFSNFEDLNYAINVILEKGENAIAIHDRFKNTKDNNYKFQEVPIKNEATYWLAQNKLVEGVDDYKFAILGVFEAFDNARSLIQQIGRVVRKKSINSRVNKCWIVINTADRFQEELWKTYIDYESDKIQNAKLPVTNYINHFKEYLSSQPKYLYSSRKFLKRFNVKENLNFEEVATRYKIPLRVNIFSLKDQYINEITVENMLQEIIGQKEVSNEFVLGRYLNKNGEIGIIVYVKFGNSPILSTESFVELKLGLLFVYLKENYLFYNDTNNYIPKPIIEVSNPVRPNKLQRLFNDETEFTEVTLKNGMITYNAIQRQVLNSKNIKNVAPNVTDKYKFCTTITGNISDKGKKHRRYVGFSNARVTDNTRYVLLIDYLYWIENISNRVIKNEGTINSFFDRYAPIEGIPQLTSPVLITFNFNNLNKYIVDEEDKEVKIEDLNYKVLNNKTNLVINGKEIELSIKFENKKYILSFNEAVLNHKYRFKEQVKIDDEYLINENETVVDYLNQYQDFHIVTADTKYIYYRKNFYKCEIDPSDSRLEAIFSEYELVNGKKIESEKGDTSTNRNEWSEDSLFYLVSSLGKYLEDKNEIKEALINMDYLVCTDLRTEIADFIGLDTKHKRIYFIHCKAKEGTRSASVFQDICSQIIKNLDYAHPLSNRIPDGIESWDGDWIYKKVVRKRIIKGDKNAKSIWKLIKEYQRDPESTTYIWALTAKMFSLKEYKREKQMDIKQKPEIIQIDYILMNTWAAVQSIGAKFKFFFDKKE
nr:DEAD/DEAH box helicase family protein [Caldibacillus thermoamylovorans]